MRPGGKVTHLQDVQADASLCRSRQVHAMTLQLVVHRGWMGGFCQVHVILLQDAIHRSQVGGVLHVRRSPLNTEEKTGSFRGSEAPGTSRF